MAKIFKTSPFQLNDVTSWSGLTRESHLINAFGDEPQYLDNTIRNIFATNVGMSFDDYLSQFAIKYVDEDKMFRWKLQGHDEKNIALQSAWEDSDGTVALGTNNPRPGVNNSKFYLDFAEDYFSVTQVIVGEKPDLYHLRIMAEPRQISVKRFRYEVQLVTQENAFFMPVAELTSGKLFSFDYGLTERYLSKDGFDISFSSPFTMQNRISMFRLNHLIPGEMIDKGKNKPLVFGFKGEDGQVRTAWIPALEFEFMKQYKRAKNRLVFYGKSTLREDGTSAMFGTSGNVIESGLGIQEQFSPSNQSYYDTLSWDRLVNTLLEISINKHTMEDRHFVIGTGEYGLKYLHEMVATKLTAADYNWLGDNTGRGYSWNGNDINVKFGQFRGFATINGLRVTFMHIDHYDDIIRNKVMHPNGGPASSYRMTIMDMGSKSEPNIHKVRIKGFEPQYAHIIGMRDPYNKGGLGKAKEIATRVDGYEMLLMDKEGAVVIDPTRVVEFIPSILA